MFCSDFRFNFIFLNCSLFCFVFQSCLDLTTESTMATDLYAHSYCYCFIFCLDFLRITLCLCNLLLSQWHEPKLCFQIAQDFKASALCCMSCVGHEAYSKLCSVLKFPLAFISQWAFLRHPYSVPQKKSSFFFFSQLVFMESLFQSFSGSLC